MSDQNFKHYAKELTEGAADRDAAISEGLSNMKSRIRKLDLKPSSKTPAQKSVEAKPAVQPSSVDKVIDKYRSQISGKSGIDTPEVKDQPVTKAGVENTKAVIRALAGQRGNSGDDGKAVDTRGGSNQKVGFGSDYAANVASFTLEEYQAHINASFGIVEEEVEEEILEEEVLEEELTVVEVLSEALLGLEEPTWQEVDRVSREVCLENAMTLKELNSEFRSVFGEYPDKWAKQTEEGDLVGYFPLEEALRLNKIGMVYDVSFLYRGGTQRFSFFWPEATRPTFEDMQKAVQKFYPNARLLTFYLSKSNEPNFMVTVPPMNESFQFVSEDSWVELSDADCDTYDHIAEEIGEPVSPIVAQEEGGYAVVVEDHDTGDQETIYFGEGLGAIFKKKEKTREQKIAELERLHKHATDPSSDLAKRKKTSIKPQRVKRYAVKSMNEDWQKANRKDKTDGMSQKAVNAYRRENPGSKLKTAVTEKNPSGKRAKRRSSYCSRSAGQQKMHNIDCSKDRDKAICKARRRWNC